MRSANLHYGTLPSHLGFPLRRILYRRGSDYHDGGSGIPRGIGGRQIRHTGRSPCATCGPYRISSACLWSCCVDLAGEPLAGSEHDVASVGSPAGGGSRPCCRSSLLSLHARNVDICPCSVAQLSVRRTIGSSQPRVAPHSRVESCPRWLSRAFATKTKSMDRARYASASRHMR